MGLRERVVVWSVWPRGCWCDWLIGVVVGGCWMVTFDCGW